jgi:hypothetical protein
MAQRSIEPWPRRRGSAIARQAYRRRALRLHRIDPRQTLAVSYVGVVFGIFPTALVAVGGGGIVLTIAMIASKELRSS